MPVSGPGTARFPIAFRTSIRSNFEGIGFISRQIPTFSDGSNVAEGGHGVALTKRLSMPIFQREQTFRSPQLNSRKPIITGTSRRASVGDTSVWQLDVLPSVEAYCGATRTECVPFLDKDVSSMISQASSPPICASASISKAASKGIASQTPLETQWCKQS
jgi:hypothetical protein